MKKEKAKEEIQSSIYEGNLENGRVLINEFKNNFGSDDEIKSMEAIIDFYEGNYNKALISAREGLKYNIFSSDLYYTMGNIYEEISHHNRAYLCYEQALYLCEKDENRNEIKKTMENLTKTYDVNVKNTSFVILTYNQLEYTKLCIDSIRKYNDKNTYEIIIVCNKSEDGTVEWLNKQKDIKVIFNNDNKSFQSGYNQGINSAKKENDIFLLNSDMVIMPNSRFNMRMGLYSNEKVGATGAVSNSLNYFKETNKNFSDFNDYLYYSISNNITDESRYEQRLKLDSLPILIGRKSLNKVEISNEQLATKKQEDYSLNIKVDLQGYRLLLCKDSYIHDFKSDSYKENLMAYNKILSEEHPLVSIVIDAKEDEIDSIIDSILEQTYENIEIIIITDNDNCDNENIKYYKKNNSITHNENIDIAINKVAGKYFAVVEENVFWDSKKISKMIKHITKEDIALVIDGIDTNEEAKDGRKISNYIARNIIKLISNTTLGIINKDYYINQYGTYFNERFIYLKDISTYCSCLKYGKVIGINNGISVDNSSRVTLDKLFDSLPLVKKLKEERIFKSSNEYLNVVSEIFNEIENVIGVNITKEIKEQINILRNNYEIKLGGYNFYNFGFGSQIGGGADIVHPEGIDIVHPEGIDIGNNTTVKENCTFMIPYGNLCEYPRISIGNNCDIGKRLNISATNKIVIEDNCILASNIHITDHNHEYKRIGIPIREQGVTSFEDEVVIGRGSWIANNCVIVGNVKIGRGCTIGANSVVISDIPDYCVAVGSPAKVIKYFNINTGEWVRVKDEEKFKKYQAELKDRKPLLTIGIPTYNRASYLERCLENIYEEIGNDKLFEVLVVDNGSKDATSKVIKRYKSKYDNLTEITRKETISANENISSIYKLAKGEFVNSHGDDDYYNPRIIYIIIETLFHNRDISLLFTSPSRFKLTTYVGNGINEYINEVSYFSTLITGLIIKKSAVDEVFHKKVKDCCFNQVIYQLEALKDNKKFAILSGDIFTNDSGEHKPSGYNFGEFFIASYLDLIEKYKKYGITNNTFLKEKENLLNNMIIPWIVKITNKDIDLSLENIVEIYSKYYKNESYYEEKLKIIKDYIISI